VTVHAFTAGADAADPVVVGLAVMSSAAVGALVVVRVVYLGLDRRPVPARIRVPVTSGSEVPPPPRDGRIRYDPARDPLFLPRAGAPEPSTDDARAAEPVSLPSTVAQP
jgi:hypothetical protein